MNPQTPPTPEQIPAQPMVEIPVAPEVAVPAAAPIQNPVPADDAANLQALPTAPAAEAPAVQAAPAQPTVGPVVAGDVDVIEKEWVDKAEAVIAQTAGDPHAEEEAIEDLQIDYMKKRYGKDVAKSE